MKWKEVTIQTAAAAEEVLPYFLQTCGADGVSIEESWNEKKERNAPYGEWFPFPLNDIPEGQICIKAYYSLARYKPSFVREVKEEYVRLKQLGFDFSEPMITVREVDESDWETAWKQYYKPLHVSRRMTVKPVWEPYHARDDEMVIELDPGMAFGTGTHATTILCMKALENVVKSGDDIIDVGTGSGVLAIAAKKLGARHVLALDLDPVAVQSAEENAALNHLQNDVTVRISDLLQIADREQPQDLGIRLPVHVISANILAEVIIQMIDDVKRLLAYGGHFIASGIWKNKEYQVETALKEAGFLIEDKSRLDDWFVFVAKKRKVVE